ncbi:MAG: hypothetical protein A2V65_03015 [Deltaproteobacteria bacterium RBG_13_49_15]|nr:MAG: hypothetical protein A2V65_03015 [Deltaproteobacteria bacterium RBG_13_49_15]
MIVTLGLISVMLVFSVPRLQDVLISNDEQSVYRKIIAYSSSLKNLAVLEQKRFFLHLDIDANRIWITYDQMSQEETLQASKKGYALPKGIRIADLEILGKGRVLSGVGVVSFYRDAYADPTWIHLETDEKKRSSIFIEPFLSKARWLEGTVGFEN